MQFQFIRKIHYYRVTWFNPLHFTSKCCYLPGHNYAYFICYPAGSSVIGRAKSQQKKPVEAAVTAGNNTNNRLSNFSSMRLSGRSTPNPVRRNTTRAGHNQHQGAHGNRPQSKMRQLSVDPSVLQCNNSNVVSAIQQQQHSSAPQSPLAGENERHVTLTRQKSLINNGTTNADNEPQVIWVKVCPCVIYFVWESPSPSTQLWLFAWYPACFSTTDYGASKHSFEAAENPEGTIYIVFKIQLLGFFCQFLCCNGTKQMKWKFSCRSYVRIWTNGNGFWSLLHKSRYHTASIILIMSTLKNG